MDKGIRQPFDVPGAGAGPDGLAAAAGPAECGVCGQNRQRQREPSGGGLATRSLETDSTTRADQRGRAPSEPQT